MGNLEKAPPAIKLVIELFGAAVQGVCIKEKLNLINYKEKYKNLGYPAGIWIPLHLLAPFHLEFWEEIDFMIKPVDPFYLLLI